MQAQAPHAGTLAKRMVCRHYAPATIKSKTSSLYMLIPWQKKSWQNCHCCNCLLYEFLFEIQMLDFNTLTGKPHCCQKRLTKAAENSVMLRANLWEPSLSDPIWHHQMVSVVQCHIVLWYQSEPWMWTNRSFKNSQSAFFAIAYSIETWNCFNLTQHSPWQSKTLKLPCDLDDLSQSLERWTLDFGSSNQRIKAFKHTQTNVLLYYVVFHLCHYPLETNLSTLKCGQLQTDQHSQLRFSLRHSQSTWTNIDGGQEFEDLRAETSPKQF